MSHIRRALPPLFTQNPEIKADLLKAEIVITEKSKALQKQGLKGQRFVINTYVDDEKGQLIQTRWPSIIGGPPPGGPPETPEEKYVREKQEALAKEAKYDPADLIIGPSRGLMGVVHTAAKEKDNKSADEFSMSGSAYKIDDNRLSFTGRSTNNFYPFEINSEFYYLYYYYRHDNFEPIESFPYSVEVARSLSWEVLETWITANEKILPELNEGKESSQESLALSIEASRKNCIPLNHAAGKWPINEWWSLYGEDVTEETRSAKFHALWMHTIYIASGIKHKENSPFREDDGLDAEVIKETLKTAKNYGLELNVDFIPQDVKNTEGATALIQAVRAGKMKAVEYLIDAGANIHARDYSRYSALDYAIKINNIDLCQLLMKKGATLNEISPDIVPPLHNAVVENRPEIVKLLIESKANHSAQSMYGWTALHVAANNGNRAISEMLIDAKANIDIPNDLKRTPVMQAVYNDKIETAELLINAGANIHVKDIDGLTVLDYAIKKNNFNLCRLLIEKGAILNEKKEGIHAFGTFATSYVSTTTPLHTAVMENRPEIVELLLKNKANPSSKGIQEWTPLHIAAFHGNVHIAKILLDEGANINDINSKNDTPVNLAILYNKLDIFKLFLPKISPAVLEEIADQRLPEQIRDQIEMQIEINARNQKPLKK
jgi:ankyrin repeat protein